MQETAPRAESLGEAVPRRRTAGRSRPSSRGRRRARLRLIYFSLAAVWGFVVGTAALAVGSSAAGRPLVLDPRIAGALVLAAAIAVIGGYVASRAYREATDRQ